MNSNDIRLDLLRKIELNPSYTQRELSRDVGVSLGKVNYCMQKLIEKGLVKLINFGNSSNKAKYIYLLTPYGIEQKSILTYKFLRIKMKEYELLKEEIDLLKKATEEFK